MSGGGGEDYLSTHQQSTEAVLGQVMSEVMWYMYGLMRIGSPHRLYSALIIPARGSGSPL